MILHESTNLTPIIVNVQAKNQNDYQLVYASQLYGTFFAVGAKLSLSSDEDKLIGIDLSINNYKGLYNIGFLQSTKNSWKVIGSTGIIILHLQVDNGQNSANLSREITMHLPTEIDLASISNLIITRELISLTIANPIEEHLDEAIFDSEFYVRNGQYIAAIERMDQYLPDEQEVIGLLGNMSGPKNCMTTLAKLI